ncbi:hypothetical protein ACP275_01G082000 [Erythranthe tilingii]
MTSVNQSFCILFVIVFASVGQMVQVVDAEAKFEGTTSAPVGAMPNAELAKKCLIGLGECGSKLCDDLCCDQRCSLQYPYNEPHGYCNNVGSKELCYCSYDCP